MGAAWTTNNTTSTFVYKSGASTSIGIGVSVGGGPFKAAGTSTTTLTSSATIGFAPVGGPSGHVWRTEFVFSKFRAICFGYPTQLQVRATSFAGGANVQTSTTPPTAPYCNVYPAHTFQILDDTRASGFSAAVSGDIGINLSATTGYNSSTSLRIDFAVGKRLCGKYDYPAGAPGSVVAKI
jgi:hypothetical protein